MFQGRKKTISALVSIGKQIHFSIDSIQILPVQCAAVLGHQEPSPVLPRGAAFNNGIAGFP